VAARDDRAGGQLPRSVTRLRRLRPQDMGKDKGHGSDYRGPGARARRHALGDIRDMGRPADPRVGCPESGGRCDQDTRGQGQGYRPVRQRGLSGNAVATAPGIGPDSLVLSTPVVHALSGGCPKDKGLDATRLSPCFKWWAM